jgi:HlyD family secretion protein
MAAFLAATGCGVIVPAVNRWLFAVVVIALIGCQRRPPSDATSGTLQTDEVHVASRFGGRLVALSIQEGDSVKPGQLLAELAAPELLALRDQTAALLSELRAGSRTEEIAAAKSDWEAIIADLELARIEERRIQDLAARQIVPPSDLDRAVARVRSLEKSAEAAQNRHHLLVAGTRPERIAQTVARLAEVDAQVAELKIFAPTNGVIEVLPVKVGDVLAPNREVATLIMPQHLWVRVYVPQPWLGHIHVGDRVKVRPDAFPSEEMEGEVEQVSRQAEFTPRNVQTPAERIQQVFGVKVRLQDSKDRLRAGMSVDVHFPNVPEPFRKATSKP